MQSQSSNDSTKDYTVGAVTTTSGDPFARVTEHNSQKRYFISYATDGADNGRMRSHVSMNQDGAMKNRPVARSGQNLYELREVSEESFTCYMDFLQRGDEKALRNAERYAQ